MAVSVIPGKPVDTVDSRPRRARRPVRGPDGTIHESVTAAARAASRPIAKIWELSELERQGWRFATDAEAIEAGLPPFPAK